MVDRHNHEFPNTSGHSTNCWVNPQCVRTKITDFHVIRRNRLRRVGEISGQQWHGEVRVTLEKSETSAIVGDHIVHVVVSRLVRA